MQMQQQQGQVQMQQFQQLQSKYGLLLETIGAAVGAISSLTLSDEACTILLELDEEDEHEDEDDEGGAAGGRGALVQLVMLQQAQMGQGAAETSIAVSTMQVLVSLLQYQLQAQRNGVSSTAATSFATALSVCRVVGNLGAHDDADYSDRACEMFVHVLVFCRCVVVVLSLLLLSV